MSLDTLDRELLQRIQSGLPVTVRPYRALAEQLGCSEEEVLGRITRLKADHVIRELGPVFDLKRLGYVSTLCSAKTAPEAVQRVADFISGYDEVTHNYLRNHAYNVWFTLIAPSQERIEEILNEIRAQDGVDDAESLPATKTYKIKVQFNTTEEDV